MYDNFVPVSSVRIAYGIWWDHVGEIPPKKVLQGWDAARSISENVLMEIVERII